MSNSNGEPAETGIARQDESLPIPARRQAAAAARIDVSRLDPMVVCEALARSGYFPNATTAQQALVQVLLGQELGIGPVMSMSSIHIIERKPTASAGLLLHLVRRSGRYDYQVIEHSDERAEIEWYYLGKPQGRSAWTMADAKRAGVLNKQVWQRYPRQMLFARAVSEGVRTFCPDVMGGTPAYVPEELGADVDADGCVLVIDTPAVPAPAAETKPVDGLAQTKQELAALLDEWGCEKEGRPRFIADLLCLEETPRLSALAAEQWVYALERMRQAMRDRTALFAAWGKFCAALQISADDRGFRLASWGAAIGQVLPTSKLLVPSDIDLIRKWMREKQAAEPARPETEPEDRLEEDAIIEAVSVDYADDPFVGE